MSKQITPNFRGDIIGNSLKLEDEWSFKKFLSELAGNKESVPIVLNIQEWKNNRSKNQNAYYWGVVIPMLSDHLGYLPDETHEAIKWKFLRKGGTDKLPTVRSSTSLDKIEWEDLMEKIRIWAAMPIILTLTI